MGGPTGQKKNAILRELFKAEQHGRHVRVKDLAERLGRTMSTISEHIADLATAGEVRERLRGEWELTPKGSMRARMLLLQPQGIQFRGLTAAGPAIRVHPESPDEFLPIYDLDPNEHFALRVRGTSMVGFGILDGDLVVLRRVSTWLEVPEGAIVAALVPEGTDLDAEDWLEQLAVTAMTAEGANQPALDHVTLKKFDVRLRSYVSQGVDQARVGVKLTGSQGLLRPGAVAIAGVVVRLQRDRF
jgi:SOS-response transcriptional repressor LexA